MPGNSVSWFETSVIVCSNPGEDPGGTRAPLKLEKIWFFGVKSWFFTRNTTNIFLPPLGAIFLCAPPLTWNPGSAPVIVCSNPSTVVVLIYLSYFCIYYICLPNVMIIVYEIKFWFIGGKMSSNVQNIFPWRKYPRLNELIVIYCIKRYKSNLPYDRVIDGLRWYIIKL